ITYYILPYVTEEEEDDTVGVAVSPAELAAEELIYSPFFADNDCTLVPIPSPSPSQPYVITPDLVGNLQPYLPVWPGAGGDLGSPYLYVEATGCCSGSAILESDSLTLDVYENVQLAFRYHMQGAEMGSLALEVSLDGGETWVQHWLQEGASGQYWQQESLDLTAVLNGVEGGLLRFVAQVGDGDLSDIALDDISLLAAPEPLTVFEEEVLTFDELSENCWVRVEFEKPSDMGSPCHPEPSVERAELRLNLSLGDNYRYGGTELGEGVDLMLGIEALDADGQVVPGCSASEPVLMEIVDDRHPEQLYLHDFKSCYDEVDRFNLVVMQLDTGGAEFPVFVDDVEFHVHVDVEEHVTAHGQSVSLNSPVLPGATLAPVQFSWEADCDFPLYRFQLLRLHDIGVLPDQPCLGGPDPCIRTHAAESDWSASALTLEVPDRHIELTMMEGTGYYAWRVHPIGNRHPGREANDLNYGRYTTFEGIDTQVETPQTLVEDAEAGLFWFEDPNDASGQARNRTMERAFSRNLGDGEALLVRESVQYLTESGFAGQGQVHLRSQGVTIADQGVRDFSGRSRMSVLPVPIGDEVKGNLDHESGLILSGDGPYTAEHFDADGNFREPLPMQGAVSDYYSDDHPDASIPNAAGHPYSTSLFTRDGTNRPVALGVEGPVKRLRESDPRVTQIYYSSVGEEELLRVFGHEAPDPRKVEKVITVDPEHITHVAYVDEQGRTIATCLARNAGVDEEKIEVLAPGEGTTSTTAIEGVQVSVRQWTAFHEFSLSEPGNVTFDYLLEQPSFQALCDGFCATCDYRARFQLTDMDAPLGEGAESALLLDETMVLTGAQWASCPPVQTEEWSGEVALPPGRYLFSQKVEFDTAVDGVRQLDLHVDAVRDAVQARLSPVTDPLKAQLQAIVDGETLWLDDFHAYCADNSTSTYEDDAGDLWYVFDVEGCDQIEIPHETCPYDCSPETRDFTAFFLGVVEESANGDADVELPAPDFGVWGQDQFNQVVENLLADGEAEPECYPGYGCYAIHEQLDALARQYALMEVTAPVVDLLVAGLGPHFRDVRDVEEDGEVNGQLVDGTAPLGDQGWKSHPHKFIRVADGDPCLGAGSAFQFAVDFAGFNDLDYAVPEDKVVIEQTLMALHNCLHGPTDADVQEALALSDEEIGPAGVHAKNVMDLWEDDCRRAVAAKAGLFAEVAGDFVDPEGNYADGEWPLEALDWRDCIVARLTEHAEAGCGLPYDIQASVGDVVAAGGLLDEGFFRVVDQAAPADAPGSGEFVRYGGAEYGPHAVDEEFQCDEDRFGLEFEDIKDHVLVQECALVNFEPQWTEADIERVAAITYGAVELCGGDCGDGFELLDAAVSRVDEGAVLFSSDSPFDWDTLHTAQGTRIPDYTEDGVVLTSWPMDTLPTVEGNGVVAVQMPIEFEPGVEYEIRVSMRYVEGERMDHLFGVISPAPYWRPECALDRETLYPPAYTNVIANWSKERAAGDGRLHELRQDFVWEPLSGAPAEVAPNQFIGGDYNPEAFNPNAGWLCLYPKQYLQSEGVQIRIESVRIAQKTPVECDPLYVRYHVPTPQVDTTEAEPCEPRLAEALLNRIRSQEEGILDRHAAEVEAAYMATCPPEDALSVTQSINYHHYTLHFYDAAGRRVRTVPPKGVDVDDAHTRASVPEHTHVTEYTYNGLGNLLRKESPDGGVVHTWYDRLERVRFTQTAQDVLDGQYRYICYDPRSRPVRSGVNQLGSDVLGDHVDEAQWPVDDPSDPADCAACEERIHTVYGEPLGPWFGQTHLVDRLSYLFNDKGDTIAYSYDAQGHIDKVHQHVSGLGSSLLEYTFDAATGLVQQVALNRGRADQFFLRNEYDEDQRLVAASSSSDGHIWHRDVTNIYYDHGPLRRQELGHYGVQGVDFTYNIHGGLIGVNTPSLSGEDDPGGDGQAGGSPWVAPDVFGEHIAHYRGEFGRTDSPLRTDQAAHPAASDLFHGEVASVSFQQRHDFGDGLARVGHLERYDELGRLSGHTFRSFSSSWTEDASLHSATFGYDANGNMTSLTRSGQDGVGLLDDLSYAYVPGRNWLDHVTDAAGEVTPADLASQQEHNYTYDEDGRLTGDAGEGLQGVSWRADGKVEEVQKADTVIQFRYNPLGHRVAKVISSDAGTSTTWYVRSQEGKIMAMYHGEDGDAPTLDF
ncbi:MAG: hypothetical protein ACPHBM_03670, partial [Flavobacteriales bacterium]